MLFKWMMVVALCFAGVGTGASAHAQDRRAESVERGETDALAELRKELGESEPGGPEEEQNVPPEFERRLPAVTDLKFPAATREKSQRDSARDLNERLRVWGAMKAAAGEAIEPGTVELMSSDELREFSNLRRAHIATLRSRLDDGVRALKTVDVERDGVPHERLDALSLDIEAAVNEVRNLRRAYGELEEKAEILTLYEIRQRLAIAEDIVGTLRRASSGDDFESATADLFTSLGVVERRRRELPRFRVTRR